MSSEIFDLEALRLADYAISGMNGHDKSAFVAAGDPSMMALDPSQGGGGGGDPSAGGGAPPPQAQDPSAMGAGGMPPGMDPSMMGAPPGTAAATLSPMIGQLGQAAAEKPKLDEKMIQLQILQILAQMCDYFGIKVSPSAMLMAPPTAATAQQPAQAQSQPPIQPIAPMAPGGAPGGDATKQGSYSDGTKFQSLSKNTDRVSMILARKGLLG